ncbi:MAG: pentapeptide repeat-containing protein [Candidatus Melainabacteria bacterium]|nr:pentapeptide repeat-containing protein [Candidatus Melainabacteria bacterium]
MKTTNTTVKSNELNHYQQVLAAQIKTKSMFFHTLKELPFKVVSCGKRENEFLEFCNLLAGKIEDSLLKPNPPLFPIGTGEMYSVIDFRNIDFTILDNVKLNIHRNIDSSLYSFFKELLFEVANNSKHIPKSYKIVNFDLSGSNLSNRVFNPPSRVDRALKMNEHGVQTSFSDSLFQNCNLMGADLSGCGFSRSSFENADLTGANLTNTTAKRANFSNSILHDADLSSSDFTESRFTGADFLNSVLHKTCLARSILQSTNLMDAKRFDEVNIAKAILPNGFNHTA